MSINQAPFFREKNAVKQKQSMLVWDKSNIKTIYDFCKPQWSASFDDNIRICLFSGSNDTLKYYLKYLKIWVQKESFAVDHFVALRLIVTRTQWEAYSTKRWETSKLIRDCSIVQNTLHKITGIWWQWQVFTPLHIFHNFKKRWLDALILSHENEYRGQWKKCSPDNLELSIY